MATAQDIQNILLSRGYQEQLFSGLTGSRRKEKGGRETLCNCPFCDDTGNHFSYSSSSPVWKCWKCDESGDWITYLEKSRSMAFVDAALHLAEVAGMELDGSDPAKYQAYTRKASILEAAQLFFLGTICHDDGAGELSYLIERGYSQDDIDAMQVGAYVDRNILVEALTKGDGYTEQELKESGLLTKGFGETHTLTMLWRDATGRAIGLACRSILPADELKAKGLEKYKYSYGLQKDSGLVGFSSVRGSEQLVLVEGILDALLLNARGFKAVATGGTSLSAGQVKAMESTGTKELLLAMDTDEPGRKATERIIKSLSTSRLRLYVVSTGQYKDADELVRKEGAEAFQACLKDAERASGWYARMLVNQQDITTDIGLDRAVSSVLEYTSGLVDGIDRRAAEEMLKQATGLSDEDLAVRKQKHQEQASSQAAQASLKSTLRKLQQKVDEADITGAEVLLQEGLSGLRQSRGVEAPEAYGLTRLLKDISNTTEGLETGYSCIDNLVRIPEGALTIVAGRPAHGKTAFMANLLVNQVEKYSEKVFYFFSYEESRARLAIRLLMLMADEAIQSETNKGAYFQYLKAGRQFTRRPRIEQAITAFDGYTGSGRLIISDTMPVAEDLASIIGHVCSRQDVGAVYVDYIQKVPVRKPQPQRYLDIKRASELLLKQAVSNNVPIILGAQLGRQGGIAEKWENILSRDNLRESGDIEQDANLVLGLWNEVAGRKAEEEAAVQEYQRLVELKVACLKNRDGRQDWTKTLSFDGATQRIAAEQQQAQAQQYWNR